MSEVVGLSEGLGERDRQQEREQDLGTGLGDPKLLEQLLPMPVQALGLAFVRAGVGLSGHACALRRRYGRERYPPPQNRHLA
jgi:hypothetical protein